MNYYSRDINIKSLERSVSDVEKSAKNAGIGKLSLVVCFNIASHTDPYRLNRKQAEKYIYQMKQLLAAHYLQARTRQ